MTWRDVSCISTDQVSDIPPDIAVPLLMASELYLLDRLKVGSSDDVSHRDLTSPLHHYE